MLIEEASGSKGWSFTLGEIKACFYCGGKKPEESEKLSVRVFATSLNLLPNFSTH